MSEQSPSLSPPAWHSWQAWSRFLIPVALGVIADQMLKAYSFPHGVVGDPRLPQGLEPYDQPRHPVIPHVLGFQTIVNPGAVFGWGRGNIQTFEVFSFLAIITIIVVFVNSRRKQAVTHIALGMILAGAIGNLYDRMVLGVVRDMLRFYVDWYPFIFNIADVMLCIGVPLLMICWMFPEKPKNAVDEKLATGQG